MAGLKDKWDKHPLRWLSASIIGAFITGFAAGNYIDSILAEINGKQILSDAQVAKLNHADKIAPDETIIKKSVLSSLKLRPQTCPQKICSENSITEVRDCITEKDPKSIKDKFDSPRKEQNEKLFQDKYFSRWVCAPGWKVKIYDEPEINKEGYWEFTSFWQNPKGIFNPTLVDVMLDYKNSAKNISKNDTIIVQGRLSRGTSSSLLLTESHYTKIK